MILTARPTFHERGLTMYWNFGAQGTTSFAAALPKLCVVD
jgi:hypothetical protein